MKKKLLLVTWMLFAIIGISYSQAINNVRVEEVLASDDFEDDAEWVLFDNPQYADQAALNNALGGTKSYCWKPWSPTWGGGCVQIQKSARTGTKSMQLFWDGLLLLDGFTIDSTKIYQLEVDIHPGGGTSDGWNQWAGIDLYTPNQPAHEWSEPAIRIRITNNDTPGNAPFQVHGDFFTGEYRTYNSSLIIDFNSNKQNYTLPNVVDNTSEFWVPLKIIFKGEGTSENPIIIDYYLNNTFVGSASYQNITHKNDWMIGLRDAASTSDSYFDNFKLSLLGLDTSTKITTSRDDEITVFQSTKNSLNIQSNHYGRDIYYEIYNITGRKVLEDPLINEKTTVSTDNMKGVYILKILDKKKGTIRTKSIIII